MGTPWFVNCVIFCFQVIVIQIMVAIVQQVHQIINCLHALYDVKLKINHHVLVCVL